MPVGRYSILIQKTLIWLLKNDINAQMEELGVIEATEEYVLFEARSISKYPSDYRNAQLRDLLRAASDMARRTKQ